MSNVFLLCPHPIGTDVLRDFKVSQFNSVSRIQDSYSWLSNICLINNVNKVISELDTETEKLFL